MQKECDPLFRKINTPGYTAVFLPLRDPAIVSFRLLDTLHNSKR